MGILGNLGSQFSSGIGPFVVEEATWSHHRESVSHPRDVTILLADALLPRFPLDLLQIGEQPLEFLEAHRVDEMVVEARLPRLAAVVLLPPAGRTAAANSGKTALCLARSAH